MKASSAAQRLESGEALKIKYRYPQAVPEDAPSKDDASRYGVRTDRLVDVSAELDRFYVKFRGKKPIWLEADEVIEITPDDGIYEECFPDQS
ncbi:MAG TPA: hypothetical protein VGK34_06945 [Armatimonadota bacterium]